MIGDREAALGEDGRFYYTDTGESAEVEEEQGYARGGLAQAPIALRKGGMASFADLASRYGMTPADAIALLSMRR
jgi:hypothetical protein